jgi:hypothetical protein
VSSFILILTPGHDGNRNPSSTAASEGSLSSNKHAKVEVKHCDRKLCCVTSASPGKSILVMDLKSNSNVASGCWKSRSSFAAEDSKDAKDAGKACFEQFKLSVREA